MKTISFVIPLYNEEQRIGKAFKALNGLVLPVGLKLEKVIFVNDGSKDRTLAKIQAFKERSKLGKKIQIVSYSRNQGKGYAIKKGMLESDSDYTLFFDADMSTPLTEIKKFMPYFDKNIDVVIGTRKNFESTVTKHQPLIRELLGKGFTLLTQIALNVIVTDFTCGFKAFSRNSVGPIFEDSIIKGWGYDAEILFLAKKYGFSYDEKAVLWANDERSKVKIYKAIPQTMQELWEIKWHHDIKPAVDFTPAQKALITRAISRI